MKRLLIIIITLLAVSISQADTLTWIDSIYGGAGGGDWNTLMNWFSADNGSYATALPGSSDTVKINGLVAATVPPTMPIVAADEGTLGSLMFGMDEGGSSALTIQEGGRLNAGGLMRLGHMLDSSGTINMTAGYLETANAQIGYQEAGFPTTGGDGIINMSGSCTQHFGTLAFGQDQATYYGGDGVIHLRDNAVLIVDGDMTGTDWISTGAIDADGVATKSIASVYSSGDDHTTFTVIPEPGTIGLLCLLGLAILRRK